MMTLDRSRLFLFFIPVFMLSVYLSWFLHLRTDRHAGLSLPLNESEITTLAYQILDSLGLDASGYTVETNLKLNKGLIHQLQDQLGFERATELLRFGIPGYYWDLRWRKAESLSHLFGQDEGSPEAVRAAERFVLGELQMEFDTRGNLLKFKRTLADTLNLEIVDSAQARKLSEEFIERFSTVEHLAVDTGQSHLREDQRRGLKVGIHYESEKKISQAQRTDYEFKWSAKSAETGNKIEIVAGVMGNSVTSFTIGYVVPEQYTKKDDPILLIIFVILQYCAVIVAMIVVAFRRVRAYEIGFKLGIWIGVAVAFIFLIEMYIELRGTMGWQIIFPLLFAPLFYGGSLIIVWAVSESVGRETWKEKFVSLDLLTHGHILHSKVGQSLIAGVGVGAAYLAVASLLLYLTRQITPLWIYSTDESPFKYLTSGFPGIMTLMQNAYANFYILAVYMIFVVSLLRKRLKSGWLIVVLTSLLLSLGDVTGLRPYPAALMNQFLTGMILVWSFYRFDVVTGYVALFSSKVLDRGLELWYTGNASYMGSAEFVGATVALLAVFGFVALYTRDRTVELDEITPAFARVITERQRLQRELEIARDVQMSFLPKRNPDFEGLQIASRCAPAFEVGGDYYDFITLGPRKLGVVIGDVSGKGTQAAFYMTLAKGLVRALAHVSDSPASILTQVNKLFYENVERGTFISMVFGLFDMERRVLTLARAGHNPVIMHKSETRKTEIIHPRGLALGLESGGRFRETVEEVSVHLKSGDLIAFYTDGFPEAMNHRQEEYGDERFVRTIEKFSATSAPEALEGVFEEMKQFTGKTKQHDDMTIVLVKVL